MKKYTLPWEDLDGPKFEAKPVKVQKQWVIHGTWALSAAFILLGVITRYHLTAVFGVLLILALLMEKKVVVTSRGIETFYQMRITTHYEIWPWREIEAIAPGDRKSPEHPELVPLFFRRGERVKQLHFTSDEVQQIKKLAKQQNRAVRLA